MNENQTSENFYSHKDVNEIDLGKIFRFLLMQSKLIFAIVITVFVISVLNYFFTTKRYEIKSLLQYEAYNQDIFDPSKALQLATSNSGSDVANLSALYESRTNYLKVIKDLKLNIEIDGLGDGESIDVKIVSNIDNYEKNHRLKFSFFEGEYALLDDNLEEIQTSKYGQQISFENLLITVEEARLAEYRPINIRYRNPDSLYKSLKSKIVVTSDTSRNSYFSNASLFNVSYITDDIELGKEIINYANYIFLNQRIYDENEKSRRAVDFINENIQSLKESVETNKIKLKEFREKNKSIDVSLEIEAIIKKIQSFEESLIALDIEIAKAKEIYTVSNPAYLNLLNEKMLIESQKKDVLSEIEMMPEEQQEYIDLYNELEVSQTLFEELESRRLGFSILEASTIGDIRVIDDAYVESLVSPRLLSIIFLTISAFIVACIVAIIRGFNFLPISNPAEIFDNNIHVPIVGVIPEIPNLEFSKDDLKLNSAIESLIVNISSMQNNSLDKKLITITSPSPYNGKSTISKKLAEGFSRIGKKVLLVDNDLKRGKIGKSYNVRSISEERFYSINESELANYKIDENFYLIPRVKGLNNTFQFLFSYQYKERIKFFKDHFDFVIFDTGPILSVPDSSILIEQSNFNFLVARHGINRMNEIKQSIDNFKQVNKNIDGIIYNAYAKPKSYYGYYGIYGNYSYQYYADKYLDDTYDYEKD